MKSNISEHQFLEGDDIVVVQSDTSGDYAKANTKNVTIKSLREDIRNYVEATTTKELKVFRSTSTAAGGRIDVLDNETLYYYPAATVSSLKDEDIEITSTGAFFAGVNTQKEYNEKMQSNVSDIELSLNTNSKYLDALVASTEFDDNDDPTHVYHFTNYNAYPPTPVTPDKAEVVNVNDLSYVDTTSAERDADLQDQITEQEKRITALFNVKVDSGYFIAQSDTPSTEAPGPGQINIDLTAVDQSTAEFSIHARSYTADYVGDEDEENATTLNNYIVVNPTDKIVTGKRTYRVSTVQVVDDTVPLDERVFIFTATLISQNGETDEGEFATFRVVADGEFDPDNLDGQYVKVAGDTMTGTLNVRTDDDTAINIGDIDGNVKLDIRADGSAITTKTISEFTDNEFITKNYVDSAVANIDLDSLDDKVSKTGDEMSGDLQFNTTQTAYSSDPADATAKIVFENKKNNSVTKTVQLFQPGDDNSLVIDGTLRFKNDLHVKGRILNWKNDEPQNISTRNAFIELGSNPEKGVLGFTESNKDTKCLEWNLYSGVECVSFPSGNGSGFRIRGKVGNTYADTATTNNNAYLLQTYHNSGETDEINYGGRIIGPKNIVTKEYVDDVVSTKVDKDEFDDFLAEGLRPVLNYDVTDPRTDLQFDQRTTGGYSGLDYNGNLSSSSTAYGIWMSDTMLLNFIPEKLTVDEWVAAWTGGGTMSLQGSKVNVTSKFTIDSITRYTYSGSPGYSFKFAFGNWNSSYYVNYFKTENAFSASNPIVDGLGGGPVEEVETVWTGVGRTSVSTTYPARLDSSGNLQTSSSHFGAFFPFEFLKTLHPTARGFNLNRQGASVDNRTSQTTVQLATMNGVDGVKVWQNWSGNSSSTNVTHKFKGIFISTPFDHTF